MNNAYQPQPPETAVYAGDHYNNHSAFVRRVFDRMFDTNQNEVFDYLKYLPMRAVINGGEQRDEPLATDQ